MTNDKADFTQGSILKKLVLFMMPVLGALILQAAYGAVDLLVVGRFGSTSGLSAVSTGSQVLNLVTFVVVQFAMGITVLIARYLGEKKPERIGAVIGGAAIVFTLISIALFIVMVGLAHPISVIMQAPEEAVDLTASYVRICGGGISVLLLISVLGFLRPLKRAVKTIGAAAAGDYTVRMPEKGSSELKTLAHSINEMTASINEREEKLRGIAESRKRFADAMAHEMKTPLTSILGFADILRIKSVVTDEQRRDFASAIVEEAKRLRGLSAKLLTLASTDNTPLDFADIPAAQLFSDVHATMAPVLGRRGIKLTTLHKNAVLHIDRELFLSLLYNLIDNAAKASPDNSEIWLIQSELDGHTVVSVIDRGMGMKPDTVRRATEAFYMEDKARSRKAGGAGLGLALCDDICRRHGARLEIRSTYQKGTTIIIHMNVAPIPKNQGDELEALLQKRPPREKTRDKAREKERQKRKKQRETRYKGGRTI